MHKTVVQTVGLLADTELTPNLGLTVSINKNEKNHFSKFKTHEDIKMKTFSSVISHFHLFGTDCQGELSWKA